LPAQVVVFPFEPASLTKPVAQLKNKGVYVTVVDRGLTGTSAQDAYVAGDNTAFGKIAAEYLAKARFSYLNAVIHRSSSNWQIA
jgi:ribose transport system substrate-binding protein